MGWETKTTILASIATALGFGLLAWQANDLHNEMIINERPWIGMNTIGYFENGTKIQFNYVNFGKIPNTKGIAISLIDSVPITREILQNHALSDSDNLGVIMPTQNTQYALEKMNSDALNQARDGTPLYVGLLIKYDYAGGHGESGMIMKFEKELGDFIITEEWAE